MNRPTGRCTEIDPTRERVPGLSPLVTMPTNRRPALTDAVVVATRVCCGRSRISPPTVHAPDGVFHRVDFPPSPGGQAPRTTRPRRWRGPS